MAEPKMTTKEYCDSLRQLAAKLANGELEEYRLDLEELSMALGGDEFHKVTKSMSYSRTVMNRVPEVKAVGSISIKIEEDEYSRYYVFRLNKDVKRKVITNEDLPGIKANAVAKFADVILNVMPNVTHLEGERQLGAIEGIKLYQDMIAKMIKGGE